MAVRGGTLLTYQVMKTETSSILLLSWEWDPDEGDGWSMLCLYPI